MTLSTGIAQSLGADVDGLDWSLTDGGNVFEDHMPSLPDEAVCVYNSGGAEADSLLPYDPANIQIVVRGTKDPSVAIATWYKIYDYLHGKRNVALSDGTYLVWALVVQAGPVPMGPDEQGRFRFSMNLRTEVLRTSTHRP